MLALIYNVVVVVFVFVVFVVRLFSHHEKKGNDYKNRSNSRCIGRFLLLLVMTLLLIGFSSFFLSLFLSVFAALDTFLRHNSLSSRNQEEELSKSKDITSRDSWSNDPEVT